MCVCGGGSNERGGTYARVQREMVEGDEAHGTEVSLEGSRSEKFEAEHDACARGGRNEEHNPGIRARDSLRTGQLHKQE